MTNYQKILKKIVLRILIAVPIFAVGWFLIATAVEGRGLFLKLLIGSASLIVTAVILASPIAQLISLPTGSLFNPGDCSGKPPPMYSIPKAKCSKGLYEEALSEYQKIAEQYPEEIKPYVEMITIAAENLRDYQRANRIYQRALAVVKKDHDREVLRRTYEEIVSS